MATGHSCSIRIDDLQPPLIIMKNRTTTTCLKVKVGDFIANSTFSAWNLVTTATENKS